MTNIRSDENESAARTAVTGGGQAPAEVACAMIGAVARGNSRQARMTPEAVELVAARFRILGDPVRIRILQSMQSGEKNVSELVAAVGSTQPNVSRHLRILQEAGIVGRRQEGNSVYCFITDDSVLDLCDVICGSIRQRLEATAKLFEPRRG